MRQSRLLVAILLACAGCQSSAQKPVLDPFLGTGQVPAPPTGAAVPPYYQGAPGAATPGGTPSGFGAAPGYGTTPGYGTPSAYGSPQGYGAPTGYGAPATGVPGSAMPGSGVPGTTMPATAFPGASSPPPPSYYQRQSSNMPNTLAPGTNAVGQPINNPGQSSANGVVTAGSSGQSAADSGVQRAGFDAEVNSSQPISSNSVYQPSSSSGASSYGSVDITSLPAVSTAIPGASQR